MPIRKGLLLANPEGSQFRQSGRVLFLPIRRCPNFANQEGSSSCQSGRVLFFTIRRGPNFANPEECCFCKSGEFLFLLIRMGPIFVIRRGIVLSRLKKTTKKKVVKGIRFLRHRLGTSDCTGNLPFIKNQTRTKQVEIRIFATLTLY